MRTPLRLLLVLTVLLLATSASGQEPKSPGAEQPSPQLTKFDLDFPGGTPAELVAAIQKAMGRPLNAIISPQHANRRLPPLKMGAVTAPQLFEALTHASTQTEMKKVPDGQMFPVTIRFGFRTEERPHSDTSVWFFFVDGDQGVPSPRRLTRFFLLTPYMQQGLTVDDITTAIQTGWKMRGDDLHPATMSFHRETSLLIAVGDEYQLETIQAVLSALPKSPPPPNPPPPAAPNAQP